MINRRVAIGLLERRGHIVQAVCNGREALEALRCESFDVVFMDIQMPELDGLEATAAIRHSEQGADRHVPIVAMTAHAMKGDRERCLDAGMDDYLSKPVEAKSLDAVLARWGSTVMQRHTIENRSSLDSRGAAQANECRTMTAASAVVSTEIEIFDLAGLRLRVEGDLDLLAEMIDLYLSSSPLLMTEVEAAVTARDATKLNHAAHTLKGVLRNMCAESCAEAAYQLEQIGRGGDLADADNSFEILKNEFSRLQAVLVEVDKEAKNESSCR